MKLVDIKNQVFKFIEQHPEVYDNDEGQNEEVWREFDELQDKIFNDKQTYFHWQVDDYDCCFDIDDAFDTVLSYLKENGKVLVDFVIGYDSEDHLYIFTETK